MSFQRAIQLNNHAVYCLEHRRLNDAIVWSCAALEMFQQYERSTRQVQVSQHRENIDSIDQLILNRRPGKRSYCDDPTNHFVYMHGIAMPTASTDPTSVKITPVLIFNCALSHQILASHCSDETTAHKYLCRAQRLYQLAFDQGDDVEDMIFKFATLNNIGVIHRCLGNYKESKHCFGRLVSLMMSYVDVGVESKCLEEIQGFWTNVLEGEGSIMAPAA